MHIEGRGYRAQQMIVERRHLDNGLKQFRHHWVDLGFREDEITHNHGVAVHGLERNPSAGLIVTPSKTTLRSERRNP